MVWKITFTALLALLLGAVCVIIAQNRRLLQVLQSTPVPVTVRGTVDTSGSRVTLQGRVDANISALVGMPLVRSQKGNHIGFTSSENTVVPVHLGQVTVDRVLSSINVDVDRLPEPVDVSLQGSLGTLDVNIEEINGHRFAPLRINPLDVTLPISLEDPIELEGPVDVNVKQVGGQSFTPLQINSLDPAIPVKVQ